MIAQKKITPPKSNVPVSIASMNITQENAS
jgi:hypothetical protein